MFQYSSSAYRRKMVNKNLMIILTFAAFLSACGYASKKDGVAIEDRGVATGSQGANQSGNSKIQTYGTEDAERSGISSLNQPASQPINKIIYFDYDKSDIEPENRTTIEAHATYLVTNLNTAVTLEGHADERGSREYNLALGEKRAQTVKRQLTLLGVPSNQIYTVSYGEEKPVIDNHDEHSWSQNRRVQIIY